MPTSRASSWPGDQIHVSCNSCIESRFFTHLATWEAPSGTSSRKISGLIKSISVDQKELERCEANNTVVVRLPIVSDPLKPHELQHARPSCPSTSPGVCPSLCASNWWCHPNISSSAALFSCLQSFPTLGSFLMSWLLTSGGQSTGASVSASVLPMNIQDWLVWFPCTPRVSQESSPATQFESINSLVICLFYCPTLNPYMTTGKTIALPIWTFVSKVTSLFFNTLSSFVIAFLPRSNRLLISWLQLPSVVILEPKEGKSVTDFNFSPSVCHEVMVQDAMILVFFCCCLFIFIFFLIQKHFIAKKC